MTRPLKRSDLEEIDAFFEEFAGQMSAPPDASLDVLIDQLEASMETVEKLSQEPAAPQDDLRARVHDLAQQLEGFATELSQINQLLSREV